MHLHIFHDVDPIQKRLVQLADDIGYVVLAEVTGRSSTEKLARVNLAEVELRPFLKAAAADDQRDRDDDDSAEDIECEDDSDEPDFSMGNVPSAADLAMAAVRWLQETAGAQMNSTRRRKFKVSAWSPKGDRLLYSARFSCENPDWDAAEDDDDERPRPPTLVAVSGGLSAPRIAVPNSAGTIEKSEKSMVPMVMLEAIPEGRVWKALGGGYEHLLSLYERGFGGLATLQNDAVAGLSHQNRRSQAIIESLADRLITLRLGEASVEREASDEAGDSRVREELGKQFISELGGLGRVFATAKLGMAPELVELADIVSASPELLDAMKHPAVRQMLREEKTRKELAELLLMAAKASAPAPEPTPPSNPPSAQPQAA